MRVELLVILFITSCPGASGQENLNGKWYMFARNRVNQFEFKGEKLISNQLHWDLSLRERNKPDTQIISQVIRANSNIYLYTRKTADTVNKIVLFTLQIVRPNREMIWALTRADLPTFTDTASVRQYILNDRGKKYGFTWYSEAEIRKLEQQKKVSQMTVTDFKAYVDKLTQFRAELDSLSDSPDAPDGLLYYGYSAIRNIIGQLGYNPLVTEVEYEELIRRFQRNPETRPIVDKLMK
jgi:hypothetical protein